MDYKEDKMDGEVNRSVSTLQDAVGANIPVDYEKQRDERLRLEIDQDQEEKNIGLDTHSSADSISSEKQEDGNDHMRGAGSGAPLPHTKSLRSIKSHRSYAGGDGYTCFSEDEGRRPSIPSGDTAEFLVTWDGDADPMNPRSMAMSRRWAIVLILASSSVGV